MKVTEAKQFVPKCITLESQEEVDLITSLLGATTADVGQQFGIGYTQLTDMFEAIEPYSSVSRVVLRVDTQ